MIVVDKFSQFLDDSFQRRLNQNNSIIVPIGTMIAYMSSEQIENISSQYLGNQWILHWEADRSLKQRLMEESKLTTPRFVKTKNDINKLCIVKLHELREDEVTFSLRIGRLSKKGLGN